MKDAERIRTELKRMGADLMPQHVEWLEKHARADNVTCDSVSGEPIWAVYFAPRWRCAAENLEAMRELMAELRRLFAGMED